jgi:hypothetical protein
MIDYSNNIKIVSGKFEKNILDRMNMWSETLGASQLRVDFESGRATFTVRPSDSSTSTLGTIMIFDGLENDLTGFCGYSVEAFRSNVPQFDVEFWKQHRGTMLMKLSSYMDLEQKVPITIWGASAVKKEGAGK